jgi:pimeloyl-ACP methyl ester carboxylesterase
MARSAGVDAVGYGHEVARAAWTAAGCLSNDPLLVRQVSTRNTARDMDIIRGALGVQKISYFGWSYGTYLGSVFAQMFPSRCDRIVLDSALDPDRSWAEAMAAMGPANESALDDWARWVGARDGDYHLGRTVAQVRGRIQALIVRAALHPIRVADYALDEHVVPAILYSMLYDPTLNDTLAVVVTMIAAAADGATIPLSPADSAMLGGYLNAEAPAGVALPCNDGNAPRDPMSYWRTIERSRAAQPVFGPLANNIGPCAFWPPIPEPPTRVRNSVPALIVQATGDPRTVYSGAEALHRDLTASRLVTLRARIHGTFRPGLSSCLDSAVNRYLENGTLPDNDLTCDTD